MKKTVVAAKSQNRMAAARPPSPSHRLDTLLHTVRCIAQYEDALCELSHEVKQSGRFSEKAKGTLEIILKKIPSYDYVHELDAVTALLGVPKEPRKSGAKRTAKSVAAGRRSSAAQKSGGKSSK